MIMRNNNLKRLMYIYLMILAMILIMASQKNPSPMKRESETQVPQISPQATIPRDLPPKTTISHSQETTPTVELTQEPTPPSTDPKRGSYLGRFTLTAYCPCSKCCGIYAENRPMDENGNIIVKTAAGYQAQAGYTIAVDPNLIPYGTEVIINGQVYQAQDCGGAVNGNHIDIYFDTHEEAVQFGRQSAEVYLRG